MYIKTVFITCFSHTIYIVDKHDIKDVINTFFLLDLRNPIPTPTEELDNVKWEPFTLKTQKYMDIGNKLVMHEKLHEQRYAEWEKLYPLNQSTKNKKTGY